MPIRRHALPSVVDPPAFVYRDAEWLKADPDYLAAKAGDPEAAARLVMRHAGALITPIRRRASAETIVVTPHAEEASGDNAVPQVLGAFLAAATECRIDEDIVQVNRAFDTGADPMQRMIARPIFSGAAEEGGSYIFVDDVSTLGGTLAKLGDHIRRHGAGIVGVAVLANASRSGHLVADPRTVTKLQERMSDAIEEVLGVSPGALTRDGHGISSASDRLTNSDIERLRHGKHALTGYGRAAFETWKSANKPAS